MTLTCEINEAIDKIEFSIMKRRQTVKLSVHRWEQMLRILKFYRLKEEELMRDPLWDGDQSDPASPYFHKGLSKRLLELAHREYLERKR
jgi:hypothetical protein